MENLKQIGARVGMVLTFASLVVVGSVSAASAQTDPVADAFTSMEGKITTYGGAIVALVVLAVGIFLGIKYLRKGVSKA